MADFGDLDLAIFFGPPHGIPVSFGTQKPSSGLFDVAGSLLLETMGFGGIESNLPTLRLPYNAFAVMPQQGDPLTVNGKAYVVSDRRQDGDGKVWIYMLKVQ